MKRVHLPAGIVASIVITAAILAGPDADPQRPVQAVYFPATQIISWDDGIGMLDTVTGAVHALEGNLDNPSTRMTWRTRVPAVTADHSGLLEIQRATFNDPDATFLVDTVRGTTWILRRRGPQRGTWDRVPVQ